MIDLISINISPMTVLLTMW